MSAVMTLRIDERRRAKLRRSARLAGKTESQFVRDLIDREIDGQSLGERLKHIKGKVALPRKFSDPWRRTLRARNWR